LDQFVACFEGLKDPRTGNAGLHDLHELLVIALCTVLCGGQGATHMAAFAVAKEPSSSWRTACPATTMVSAWGCEQRLVLAQIATDAKSNEITAVPKLLEMLSLKGTIVTVDALNCQREIAQKIVDQGGDYALALKGNQGTLHDDVIRYFDDPASKITTAKPVVEGDHGRIETRTATVSTDIKWLQDDHQWPGLTAIGKVDRIRETPTKTTKETAYYLLSSALTPERCNEVIRFHWGVENRLHWRLDVTMNEDQDRTRLDNGPHNLAVLRHMALNVMQKDTTKGSLRGKFMRAGWDDRYLARLLALF
jgi:predicted transposase YbfD/YdcC